MNINMLRDTDNDPGFYAAACGDGAGSWRGCTVYVSTDAGANYSALISIASPSVMGVATDVLADFSGGNIVDEISHVNVSLYGDSTLSSTTYSGLLSGVNACVIGDEILFFRDATLQGDGSYTLRGLLRGRRGSEYAMDAHVAGDRFVLLSESSMVRVPGVTADIGVEKLYKPVSSGSTLAATTEQAFTNEGAGLKPYAPVHLGGGCNAAGDVTLQWVRRNRMSGEWRDSVDVPMSEASEAYEVEIYSSASYTTLKRTITGVSSQSTTYSAADQTTDFGAPQSTVYFRVFQLSAIVGRGYAADGSV